MDFDFTANEDLKALARSFAEWANGHDCFQIYLFGSRVRGDHRPDSDVDIVVKWSQPSDEFTDWWTQQNADGFREIDDLLPGKLHIQRKTEPLWQQVVAAAGMPVFAEGNVFCVWLPPKPAI